MKKLISMLLALTLVLALVPTAFAADYVTYTFADGLTGSYAEGHSYDAATDTLTMYPGSGGKAGSYANARHDQGGYISYAAYAATIPADTTYYVSFDIKRATNHVNTLIRAMHEGDARANYSPGLDIAANGDIKLNGTHWPASGTVIGHLPVGEWHNLTFEYILNSTSNDGARCNFYLDGNYMNYGINKYHANKNKGHVQLSLAVSSNSEYVIDGTGASVLSYYQVAGRGENVQLKNMVVSTDPATLDTSAKVTSVNTRGAKNQIVFTTNVAVTEAEFAAFSGGLSVTDVAVSGKTITATLDGDMAENTDYTYSVALDGGLYDGAFKTETFENILNIESAGGTFVTNSAWKMSKSVTGRYGEKNGALAFTDTQLNGAGGGADAATVTGIPTWGTKYNYWHVPSALAGNADKEYKISLDFMQGSERVKASLIALETSYNAGNPEASSVAQRCLSYGTSYESIVNLAPDGTVTVPAVTINKYGGEASRANVQIAEINPKEWHNVTATVYVTGNAVGMIADIYFDGKLVADNYRVSASSSGIYGIASYVQTMTLTDDEKAVLVDENGALLNAYDEGRYDVLVVDNVYSGYNKVFNDSQMLLVEKADGSAVNFQTGFVDRKNPAVSVLFDSTGAVKDIKTGLLWKEALGASSWAGGVTFDSAVAGDTIKTFAVVSFTDLTPISNVLTKTIQ